LVEDEYNEIRVDAEDLDLRLGKEYFRRE